MVSQVFKAGVKRGRGDGMGKLVGNQQEANSILLSRQIILKPFFIHGGHEVTRRKAKRLSFVPLRELRGSTAF